MTYREEVKKTLIEKGFLALIILGVGIYFDYQLKTFEGRVDYQRSLFDKRRDAYQAIVLKAQAARDRILYLQSNRITRISEPTGDSEWEHTFARLRESARYLAAGSTGGGWGDPWSVDHVLDAVGTLEDLNRVRNDNALFLSTDVDRAIDFFLGHLSKGVESVMAKAKSEGTDAPNVYGDTRSQVITAYQNLLKALRDNLRIEDIILR